MVHVASVYLAFASLLLSQSLLLSNCDAFTPQRHPRRPLTSTTIHYPHEDLGSTGTALRMQKEEINHKKQTIAIVGSGAVGCYYGARLWETNQYNMKFFMRGDHYSASKTKGLNVTSVQGDVFIPPHETQDIIYNDTNDMGKVDWVIVALKSTGIDSIPSLLLPLLGKHTRVLAIMNGLVDDDIVRLLEGQGEKEEPVLTKCAAVYGGMALLCSNRKSPGHVDHSYAGKLTCSLARSCEEDEDEDEEVREEHKRAMLDLWSPTQGFEFVYDDNCVRARWSKALWNLPFNGISVAMNGITVDKIVQDAGLRKLAYRVMDETLQVANKDLEVRGCSEEEHLGETEVRLPL
jgi:2-dehydropantoate 2-reductase